MLWCSRLQNCFWNLVLGLLSWDISIPSPWAIKNFLSIFYLSAIDGELKSEKDNPTIGLLLCKGKDKLVAEYALKDINKPMGISGYKLSNKIADDLQENLPTIEDIESRINN